ncbi:MarR family winged helix-turn-helix transcriptional regulator [Mesobacillus foraminis]|uniref:MarR family winged helix-turn-helix transcriptional regulator n=1 Tax=Mesobacillus foraminis TaxID=279826 RepID=UPI000EF4E045|nr:MarR family transcriptional regulator [Mesobacillus foraminis]
MIYRELFKEYHAMHRPYMNMLNELLAKHQLFSSQWGIMRTLKLEGPKNIVEIASIFYIEKPSASNLVRKLAELGYVEAGQGKDKREKIIRLTQQGETVFTEVSETIDAFLSSIVEGISEEDQRTVISALETIRKNLLK